MQYSDLPRAGEERATLQAFIDWQRDTLARKCHGLTDAQLRQRSVPPSTLSLLGLVRHMAEVERSWFRRTLRGEHAPPRYYSDSDPDGDFNNLESVPASEAFAAWRDECEHSRAIVASHDLGALGRQRDGTQVSLRWILTHMIEEYSRHNGHADLLRERLDGEVGY
jgi:uncharacterized damage-inducible protein DinB